MEADPHVIKVGDQIIVQRQGYTKLHKLKQHGNMVIGKFTIEMDNVLGQKYCDTFQMKISPDNKKLFCLVKIDDVSNVGGSVNIEQSGKDNRHILEDNESQALTKDDLDKLQASELNSNAIVGELINNSKTFSMKTEYSQEKYIKKKEKKYFEYIQIRKPTLRLLTNMFYRQDPWKTLGIRIDDLSQILTYANIHSEGSHLLYDSGTSGLMTAALLNSIGANTNGTLIHMHPGNECQKNAVVAMQFPQELIDRCTNVNIYSVLRCFYQSKDIIKLEVGDDKETITRDKESKSTENSVLRCFYQSKDIIKLEVVDDKETITLDKESKSTENEEPSAKKPKLEENLTETAYKVPVWQIDNKKACKILQQKCDSLIITAKEHPINIVKELIPFLKAGRQLVVFSLLREPLQDLFLYLKSRLDIVAIKLCSNFLRNYQVLPQRTHPEVMMNTGGFILSAVKLNC